MFMQVIRSEKVKDEGEIRALLERWQKELRPDAPGYLGSTGGFTDDGGMIAVVRFDSQENARRNSDRPEQGEFFRAMSEHFEGEPTFIDVTDAREWLGGGSNDAGFVQVMVGTSPDAQTLLKRDDELDRRLKEARPEIIGGVLGSYGDNGYVQVAYFTSESAAREKESGEPPEDLKEQIEEFRRLLGEVTFYDLHDPILY